MRQTIILHSHWLFIFYKH